MGRWAGADRMQLLGVWKSGTSTGLRLRRESSHEEPAPNSVHLVDEDSNDTFCGTVDPAVLTRLHRPWEEWSVVYRCHDCHALSS
jgi:hypothetical protein